MHSKVVCLSSKRITMLFSDCHYRTFDGLEMMWKLEIKSLDKGCCLLWVFALVLFVYCTVKLIQYIGRAVINWSYRSLTESWGFCSLCFMSVYLQIVLNVYHLKLFERFAARQLQSGFKEKAIHSNITLHLENIYWFANRLHELPVSLTLKETRNTSIIFLGRVSWFPFSLHNVLLSDG